jgi:excisionase family DNA binding protein
VSRQSSSPAKALAAATPTEPPLLLTPEQAFAQLQVGRTHEWRLIKSGALPSVRLSPRCIRVPRQTLEALIAAGGVHSARTARTQPLQLHERIRR